MLPLLNLLHEATRFKLSTMLLGWFVFCLKWLKLKCGLQSCSFDLFHKYRTDKVRLNVEIVEFIGT